MSNNKIIKPNLFIVGAAKAGTTSLYNYLSQHSDIFMCSIKEPNFFCKDIKRNDFTQKRCFESYFNINKYLSNDPLKIIHNAFIDDFYHYTQLFRDVNNERIIGEASTSYLYSDLAAKEIHKYNLNAKIIIILRDPIDRAFSHWKMNLSTGIEKNKIPFYKAVQNDVKTHTKGYCRSHLYIELGLYYKQVKRYMNIFNNNQILILFYSDFLENKEKLINKIFSFINVPLQPIDIERNFNVSRSQMFPIITRFTRKLGINKKIPTIVKEKIMPLLTFKNTLKISKDERNLLCHYFKNDIMKLERLIKYDLSKWKLYT